MEIITSKEQYQSDSALSIIAPQIDISKYYQLGVVQKKSINIEHKPKVHLLNEVERRLKNASQLLLETSEDCNLRCLYCVHNGIYYNVRKHKKSTMRLETALCAIDYFFNLIYSPDRTKTFKDIGISFFGGEALLNREVLFSAISYAKKKATPWIDLQVRLNTNGLLLEPKTVDRLVAENVKIDISLDGPEEQHDLFRKQVNGAGSHAIIMKNITDVKHRYPDFYRSNVRFQLTLHPDHDIKDIESYFLQNESFFNPENLIINYFRFEKLDENKIDKNVLLKRQSNQDREAYEKLDKSSWFYIKYMFEYSMKAMKKPTRFFHPELSTYTGTCFPGEQILYITSEGKIKMCEKFGEFYIGDAKTGVSAELVRDLLNRWEEEIHRLKCWECDIKFRCAWCLEKGLDISSGKIQIDRQLCQKDENNTKLSLQSYFRYMEEQSTYRDDSVQNLLESI